MIIVTARIVFGDKEVEVAKEKQRPNESIGDTLLRLYVLDAYVTAESVEVLSTLEGE